MFGNHHTRIQYAHLMKGLPRPAGLLNAVMIEDRVIVLVKAYVGCFFGNDGLFFIGFKRIIGGSKSGRFFGKCVSYR